MNGRGTQNQLRVLRGALGLSAAKQIVCCCGTGTSPKPAQAPVGLLEAQRFSLGSQVPPGTVSVRLAGAVPHGGLAVDPRETRRARERFCPAAFILVERVHPDRVGVTRDMRAKVRFWSLGWFSCVVAGIPCLVCSNVRHAAENGDVDCVLAYLPEYLADIAEKWRCAVMCRLRSWSVDHSAAVNPGHLAGHRSLLLVGGNSADWWDPCAGLQGLVVYSLLEVWSIPMKLSAIAIISLR
ncbi:hypothetical protein C8Q69DRAFT_446487 [Paecilomyces variotii]|uniref:Uncharacterized protein n=1 Tax=Byssochlamys spectabilis TaxID=264951 RepID=A0A443HPJ9_BYSSP|nr:hypothetical protein C8Q69DRAFT_446487 [Paecilomyces variotii]RWQ93709.1 hypothetical protein C8Q69DRAFT_446487 [Paecilomyces variotii]